MILFFFYKTSALHNEKSEEKKEKREREKNSILFFAKRRVLRLFHPTTEVSLKLLKSLKYAGLFSMRRKVFQIFRVYIPPICYIS